MSTFGDQIVAQADEFRAREKAALVAAVVAGEQATQLDRSKNQRLALYATAIEQMKKAEKNAASIAQLTQTAQSDPDGEAVAQLHAVPEYQPFACVERGGSYIEQRQRYERARVALLLGDRPSRPRPPPDLGGASPDEPLTLGGLAEVAVIAAVGLGIGWLVFGRRK